MSTSLPEKKIGLVPKIVVASRMGPSRSPKDFHETGFFNRAEGVGKVHRNSSGIWPSMRYSLNCLDSHYDEYV